MAQRVKNLPAVQETWVPSLGWKSPWRKEWLPTQVFLAGEFHGQKSLEGYSPWGHKELDTTERLTHTHTNVIKCSWETWLVKNLSEVNGPLSSGSYWRHIWRPGRVRKRAWLPWGLASKGTPHPKDPGPRQACQHSCYDNMIELPTHLRKATSRCKQNAHFGINFSLHLSPEHGQQWQGLGHCFPFHCCL